MYMHDNIRCAIKSLELTGSRLCISFLHIIHSVQLDHYLVLSFYGGSAFLPLNEARDPLMIDEHDVPVMNRGAHPKPLMESLPILKVILPLKRHHQMKVHQFQTLT